jgi:hypothetical protein
MNAKINLKVYRGTTMNTFNQKLASLTVPSADLIYGVVQEASKIGKYVQ